MKGHNSSEVLNYFFILLGSSLILTDDFRTVGFGLIFVGLGLTVWRSNFEIPRFTGLTVQDGWILIFLVSSIVANVLRESDFTSAVLAFQFVLVYGIFRFSRISKDFPKQISITLLAYAGLLLTGYLVFDFRWFSFEGIFYNPNSLGQVVATLFIFDLALTRDGVLRRATIMTYCWRLFLLGTMILSSCRLALVIVAIVICTDQLLHLPRMTFQWQRKSLLGLLLSAAVAIGFYEEIESVVQTSVISKVERKKDDVTSGRSELWTVGLSDAGLIGKGRRYYLDSNLDDHSAHNTFVSMTVQSGYVAGFSFLCFWLSILLASWQAFRQWAKCIPLYVTLCFVLLSMGESMNGKLAMYLSFMFAARISR